MDSPRDRLRCIPLFVTGRWSCSSIPKLRLEQEADPLQVPLDVLLQKLAEEVERLREICDQGPCLSLHDVLWGLPRCAVSQGHRRRMRGPRMRAPDLDWEQFPDAVVEAFIERLHLVEMLFHPLLPAADSKPARSASPPARPRRRLRCRSSPGDGDHRQRRSDAEGVAAALGAHGRLAAGGGGEGTAGEAGAGSHVTVGGQRLGLSGASRDGAAPHGAETALQALSDWFRPAAIVSSVPVASAWRRSMANDGDHLAALHPRDRRLRRAERTGDRCLRELRRRPGADQCLDQRVLLVHPRVLLPELRVLHETLLQVLRLRHRVTCLMPSLAVLSARRGVLPDFFAKTRNNSNCRPVAVT